MVLYNLGLLTRGLFESNPYHTHLSSRNRDSESQYIYTPHCNVPNHKVFWEQKFKSCHVDVLFFHVTSGSFLLMLIWGAATVLSFTSQYLVILKLVQRLRLYVQSGFSETLEQCKLRDML